MNVDLLQADEHFKPSFVTKATGLIPIRTGLLVVQHVSQGQMMNYKH